MDVSKMGLRPTSPTRPITPDCPRSKHTSLWQKFQHLFVRDGSPQPIQSHDFLWSGIESKMPKLRDSCTRPVGVGLPRQATFKRQNSEKRERLYPIPPLPQERRAYSASRHNSTALSKFRSNSVPPLGQAARCSAPAIGNTHANESSGAPSRGISPAADQPPPSEPDPPIEYDRIRPPRPMSITSSNGSHDEHDLFEDRMELNRDLDTKWILNLSMHFRDKSDREKFFVTYAETPTRWRRVTVSCDYRNAEPGSLEMDLKELQLQRDKSMQIYEAIRDSLPEIKFYDTVTNLKLETRDGRLHVHVTEDVNEIIPYPPRSSLLHILQDVDYQPQEIRESDLTFEAHLSGFVYKVKHKNRTYIKKEIPGPDTVDEFLYEVNALHALHYSKFVIDIEAIVTDDTGQVVKGLLIGYADRGAIVDLLYDFKGEIAWERRERWARNAVQGLSEIHEEGYVQGDFTLSNIVVDAEDNAKIIDINRRGCPVGWEPPEIAKKIASNQRISMYIGQKSDLYQLGMTLWALAMDDDEPERHGPPLSTQEFPAGVPAWYQEMVRICLSQRPRERLPATELMKLFPTEEEIMSWQAQQTRPPVRVRTEKHYIDPAHAVERDDLERFGHERNHSDEILYSPESSRDDYTFTWPQSSTYDQEFDSASSEIERSRGRRRVSHHDLMMQVEGQEQMQNDITNSINNAASYDDSDAPIVSISSDGTEAHVIDDCDHLPDTDDSLTEHTYQQDNSTSGQPASYFGISDVATQGLSRPASFHNYSEVSEDTPRNSSSHLIGTGVNNFDQNSPHAPSGPAVDDFIGMGCNLEYNLEVMDPMTGVETNDDSTLNQEAATESNSDLAEHSSPPRLRFVDSGFCDEDIFGIGQATQTDRSEPQTEQQACFPGDDLDILMEAPENDRAAQHSSTPIDSHHVDGRDQEPVTMAENLTENFHEEIG